MIPRHKLVIEHEMGAARRYSCAAQRKPMPVPKNAIFPATVERSGSGRKCQETVPTNSGVATGAATAVFRSGFPGARMDAPPPAAAISVSPPTGS